MVWILNMNDMRSAHVEEKSPAFKAETRQQLIDFMARERVESYRDGKWGKVFRVGGPLEWFNEPYEWQLERDLIEVDRDTVIRNFTARLDADLDAIPRIGIDVAGEERLPAALPGAGDEIEENPAEPG